MKFILSTATYTEHFGLHPAEYSESLLRWNARESFDEVAHMAGEAGTWQILAIYNGDEMHEARAAMERIRATAHGLTEAFKSPITGLIGYRETVYKLEWVEDEGDIELLDWYAEGFEHEPEGEGSEE